MVGRGWCFICIWLAVGAAGSEEWHPFLMPWNKAPVNLSFLLDAPAGKHGFLGVKGERFVFEDGTEFRGWGVTMIGRACFPPTELSPEIAERLSQFGVNLVRFQDMDASWVQPNLLNQENASILNRETIDRLDYFLYQLENRGIYAYLDGLDSRALQSYEGIPDWESYAPGWKGYIHVYPDLRWIFMDYLDALWTHRNRYTGREYRDSPAILFFQLFHDNNLRPEALNNDSANEELYRQWGEWLQAQEQPPDRPLDLNSPSIDELQFLTELQNRSQVELANALRAHSVKIPIGGNDRYEEPRDWVAQRTMDFIPIFSLWNQPLGRMLWHSDARLSEADAEKQSSLFSEIAYARLKGKPFLVAGWGDPFPHRYRAEMVLWMAAMACFQDWQGCIGFGYRSGFMTDVRSLVSPLDGFNDPSVMGLFPAASLLFHGRHVKPAAKTATVFFSDAEIYSTKAMRPIDTRATRLVDWMKVQVESGAPPAGSLVFSPTGPDDMAAVQKKAGSSPALRRDPERGLVCIDTALTQAVMGSLSKAEADDLSALRVQTDEPFGVVAASSLDGKEISEAKTLLLTVVSESQNTGYEAVSEGKGVFVQALGTEPVLIKDTPLRLFLRTRHTAWTVSPLSALGESLESVPYQVQSGWLSFTAGIHGTIYYRLSCTLGENATIKALG